MLYKIIDNPEFFDRYTLCFTGPDGAFIYGASENPFHPLGFGQFCGDISVPDYHNLGDDIKFEDLPGSVQRLVKTIELDILELTEDD